MGKFGVRKVQFLFQTNKQTNHCWSKPK